MENNENVTPIDLVTILRSLLHVVGRLWLLGLVLVAVCAAALGYRAHLSYSPVYEASASFTVKVANPLYAGTSTYNAQTAEQMEKTFPYILSSSALRERVREQLDIAVLPSITANVIDGTNVFTLRVRDADPQRAYDVLNAMMICYPEVADYVVGPTSMVLLDESGLPTEPVNSYSIRGSLVKGGLMGAAIFVAIVLLLALLRSTVTSKEELKKLLNCQCLGALPVTKAADGSCPLAPYDEGKYGFSDAAHLIAMHLDKQLRENDQQVVLVSSAVPGEGKTTVSVNMAIELTRLERKVLLVDCDLRNPSVARALEQENRNGLSEYLEGTAEGPLVRTTEFENLSIIPGGTARSTEPEDQLSGDRMKQLMEQLKREYDCIILDTPPCGLLADASEAAELAQCAVMVVRQDFASRDQILEGARSLTESKLPIIGSVINGARSSNRYGYGYGYGYGYSGSKG